MDRADQRVAVAQFQDSRLEMIADRQRILLQAFALNHIENGEPDHARHRAAAGRGEEVALGAVGVGDLPSGDDRSQWLPITHRLGHTDDVGYHVLLLERPEPSTGPAVPHLDLIGDRQSTCRTHRRVHRAQVSIRECQSAGVAVERFRDECGRRMSLGGKRFNDRDRFRCVLRGVCAPVLAAVSVGGGHDVHPRRTAGQRVGVIGDRGGDRVGGVGPAVVGLRDGHDVVAPGRGHCQPQRQVIGFRPGVHQEHRVQRIGQGGGEALGEFGHDGVVKP